MVKYTEEEREYFLELHLQQIVDCNSNHHIGEWKYYASCKPSDWIEYYRDCTNCGIREYKHIIPSNIRRHDRVAN